MKRFNQSRRCPVCNGYDGAERGTGKRCFGFLSDDGEWAHCTREEYAGLLEKNASSNTYAHKLVGNCKCGRRHDPSPEKRIVATYDYFDESGELLYQVVRYEPKDFRQRRPDDAGGWIWNLKGVRRVLYRLPQLLTVDKSAIVFIVEGERDADRLAELGLVATTNASGAEKWRDEYNEHLRGRRVVILPDNDEAGHKHAEKVAASLQGIAANVQIVMLPDVPEKSDVSDWLDAGGTVEQLQTIVAGTEPLSSSDSSNSQVRVEETVKTKRVAAPKLSRKALHGLAGDIVRAIEPHSEADPAAILIQTLVGFGNFVGRTAHFVAEADRHYTNLFTVVVGASSRGRKGSSWGHVRRLLEAVDMDWSGCIVSGLSSGEGLVHHVRDDEFMPLDKRALVVEQEFASVLQVQKRESNTLSAMLRQAWDTGDLNVMRRNCPDKARGAHISIIGHITDAELKRCLQHTDAVNGYANRFLWVHARRSKKLPEGGYFHETDVAPFVRRLREAAGFARTVGEMKRDVGATALWREIYNDLDDEEAEGQVAAILSRAEAQIMRLACIYALLDRSAVVSRVHLEAAKAVWDYCDASARFIFGGNVVSQKAQKLLNWLHEFGEAGLDKTQMYAKFGKHIKRDELDALLKELNDAELGYPEILPTGGRNEEHWYAVEEVVRSCESDEFDEESQALMANLISSKTSTSSLPIF